MNVGTTTAAVTSQGLIAGRETAVWVKVELLILRILAAQGGTKKL
jgi:hypothetical protein